MSQLTKQKKGKTKRKRLTPQEKFSEALERFSRIEKQNQGFRDELEQLITRVTPQIRQSELERYQAMQALTLHLVNFFGKKTLPEYLREELYDWINQYIFRLSNNPFAEHIDIASIHTALGGELEKLQGFEQEKILKKLKRQGLSDGEIKQAEEMMQKIKEMDTIDEFLDENAHIFDDLDGAEDSASPYQDDLFGEDESLFDDGDDDTHEYQYDGFDDFLDEDEKQRKHEEREFSKLLKTTSVNKLFRRIARAIHPDLEPDAAKKKERNEKMAKLIQAREQKDISVLLQLYSDTFGKAPDDFPSDDYPKLTRIINHKIEQLRQEKHHVFDENPHYEEYYEYFHAANAKQEERKVHDYIEVLKEEKHMLNEVAAEISSLKVLRVYLSHRMEAALMDVDGAYY